jgi:CPA2 family monovalent cation:H+ antiporter-2
MLASGGARRGPALIIRRFATIVIIGLLSLEFFAVWVSVIITLGVAGAMFLTFRRQLASYYRWIEATFIEGIGAHHGPSEMHKRHAHLVPWEARLAEVEITRHSGAVGSTLRDLRIRERFGINVVVIRRDDETIVAPGAGVRLLPGDQLLCFGTDEEIDKFQTELTRSRSEPRAQGHDLEAYALRRLDLEPDSAMVGRTLRDSRITEDFGCLVVGVERETQRMRSPRSDMALRPGDTVWVVGEAEGLRRLTGVFNPQQAPA